MSSRDEFLKIQQKVKSLIEKVGKVEKRIEELEELVHNPQYSSEKLKKDVDFLKDEVSRIEVAFNSNTSSSIKETEGKSPTKGSTTKSRKNGRSTKSKRYDVNRETISEEAEEEGTNNNG